MTAAFLCLAAMPLASCATLPPVDLCKHAATRRQVYVTASAVAGADAYAASGRPVPPAVSLGREAAATALAVLDANCLAASADLSR